jgi:hypothetical protein
VLKPPLGPASTSRARSPHRLLAEETSRAAAGHEAGGRGERLARRSGLGGALERRERCAMLAPESAEKRVYLSLFPPFRSRPLRALSLPTVGPPASFLLSLPRGGAPRRCVLVLSRRRLLRACRVIVITCAREYVYVRECARACMHACVHIWGFNGPS